jgi:hypothetical protein
MIEVEVYDGEDFIASVQLCTLDALEKHLRHSEPEESRAIISLLLQVASGGDGAYGPHATVGRRKVLARFLRNEHQPL